MKKSRAFVVWIMGFSATVVIAGFLGYAVWYYKASGVQEHGLELAEKPGFRAVHWHADLKIFVCGQERKVPVNRGTPLLHTHRDANLIHVEGLIAGPGDATLGEFMEAVSVPFSREQVWDVKNGEACPDDDAGRWRMTVNGIPSEAFDTYPIKDGDRIELKFE